MTDDAVDDAVAALQVGKAGHGPGAAAHFTSGAVAHFEHDAIEEKIEIFIRQRCAVELLDGHVQLAGGRYVLQVRRPNSEWNSYPLLLR